MKKFTDICRAKKLPAETAAAFGVEPGEVRGENRLEVRNDAGSDYAEIILSGSIGKSWFDDSGITESEVRDALKSIPRGRKIKMRGNSEGGSVKEGLGIEDAIAGRSADITYIVAGYALSIASVFPLAAHKVVSPKSAIWMIHKAHAVTGGNADDKLGDSEMLTTHDQVMSEMYADSAAKRNPATARTAAQFLALMKDETWIRGSKAVEFGLADEGDEADAQASYVPLAGLYFDKLKNASPEILNALAPRKEPGATNSAAPQPAGNNQPQPQETQMKKTVIVALLATHGILNLTTNKAFTEADADADFEAGLNALAKKPGTDANAKMEAIEAKLALAEKRRLTDKINGYVDAQKITKAEVAIFVTAAITDEAATLAILDAKPVQGIGGEPAGAHVITIEDGPMTSKNGVQGSKIIPELDNLFAAHKTNDARVEAMKLEFPKLLKAAFRKDGGVQAANTFSATVTTNFLIPLTIQKLANRFAAANLFARDNSQDPFKPLAAGIQKFNTTATDGAAVETHPTDFESGGESTISAIPITPAQDVSKGHLNNSELNSGFRVADIIGKKQIDLAAKVTQVLTAPITTANFTTNAAVVSAPAAFNFSDLATLQGILKKTSIKNLLLDGEYLARIANTPGFFQPAGTVGGAGGGGMAGWTKFGWDNIALNTDWSGAGSNVRGFACGQDAIGFISGLPLNPPEGIPGNIVQTGVAMLPDVNIGIATYVWFSAVSRNLRFSFDIILGASLVDETQGVLIKSA